MGLLKLFNSETGHNQIAAGVAAGFVLGMSPTISLQSLLISICLFLFRVQIVAALLSALVFSLAAYVTGPVFDGVGAAILETAGLRPVFTALYNMPLVPWTRFNNSIVMGAGAVGLALSVPIFFLVRALVLRYRPAAAASPRKGPIRTGLVIPTVIVFALLAVFFKFFFDGSLRRALEYAATKANGAEVNIGYLRTNVLAPSIDIRRIQVTDKSAPARNLVSVDSITFTMLWDALLRQKIVVNDANVLGIEAFSPRSQPGYVVPPAPPQQAPTPVETVAQEVVEQTRKQANGNVLGEAAALLGNVKFTDQIKSLQANLKSEARIRELQAELQNQKTAWEGRVKALPQPSDLDGYRNRVKALTFDPRNPVELAKSIAEGNRIVGEIGDKVKLVDETSSQVRADIDKYSRDVAGLENLVQEDIAGLQSRLGLPDIDARAFSQSLFMNLVEDRIVGVRQYVALARQYMPAGGGAGVAADADAPVPPRRGEGRTYRFPITTSYPQFWLKHAAVSSQLTALAEYSGNVKGELIDISSDPVLTGRPMQLVAQGDFPKQSISGVDVRIVMDHTKAQPRESIVLKVASFPVADMTLADGPQVKLGLQQARGSSTLDATLVNEEMTVDLTSRFQAIKFNLDVSSALARDILTGVLNGISNVTVSAAVKGSFRDFSVRISSNLGDQLAAGFVRQLRAKVDDAKVQVRKLVDDKIAGARASLKSEFDTVAGNLTKGLDSGKAEIGKVLKEAQDQVKAAQSQAPSPLNRIFGR
ncbi:MAG: TIGR03545 family protein [Vicinamibacterales bacterium]